MGNVTSTTHRRLEWVSHLNQEEVQTLEANASKGYILEVDLEYPKELHNARNDYPITPDRLEVKKAWMSGYQKNLFKTMYGGSSNEVEKLVPNLHDKTRYVLHYRNLQLYLQLEMLRKKIHRVRVVRFDQSPWMAPYIRMNTELRKQAKSTFEQDLNNSLFGRQWKISVDA